MKRSILNGLLGLFAVAILASCSQTQELASNDQEAPRYRKVYYKNKIVYKDMAPKEEAKLDLRNAQVAQLEEETPEVIAPLAPVATEKKAAERAVTADRKAKGNAFTAPFGKLGKNFPMIRSLKEKGEEQIDKAKKTNELSLGLWIMLGGLLLVIIGYVIAVLSVTGGGFGGFGIGAIIAYLGWLAILVGGVILLIDLLS